MARCEECIHEKVCLHKANIQTDTYAYMGVSYDTESCKHFTSAADVVPKSEVERLEQLLDSNCEKCVCAAREMLNEETVREIEILRVRHLKRIAEAKAEVAREIFEEIEREINDALQSNYKVLPSIEQSEALWNRVGGKIDALRGMDGFIADLKEKYMEE